MSVGYDKCIQLYDLKNSVGIANHKIANYNIKDNVSCSYVTNSQLGGNILFGTFGGGLDYI